MKRDIIELGTKFVCRILLSKNTQSSETSLSLAPTGEHGAPQGGPCCVYEGHWRGNRRFVFVLDKGVRDLSHEKDVGLRREVETWVVKVRYVKSR